MLEHVLFKVQMFCNHTIVQWHLNLEQEGTSFLYLLHNWVLLSVEILVSVVKQLERVADVTDDVPT